MKTNIIANFIGRFWSVFSNFLFVPLYINFLGLESYSIISFTLVLNGIMAMMDAGLTSTLSREFASRNNSEKEKLKIFNTLESCYFIIAIISISLILLCSNIIAFEWLNLENIAPENVSLYLKIIGVEVGFRLLGRFYAGGFIGLEQQVKSNMYQVGWGMVRNGVVLIPIFFFPSLKFFFIWQTLTTVGYVMIIRTDLHITLYKDFSALFNIPKIEKEILKRIWKFAGGMMLISLVAGLNTQMDKLALSKLMSIETLGLYTLAFALSRGLNILTSPISIAILPRMTTLFTCGENNKAINLFNKSYLFVSIIIFSFAASMVVFSKELIWIWTNDINLAEQAYSYVPWIAAGTAFLCLQNLPFNVAIANGYTKFNNVLGITSLIITMPGYWILTKLYGGLGAASTFAIVQIALTLVFLFLVNNKFLNISLISLFIKKLLVPLIISLCVTIFYNYTVSFDGNRFTVLMKIGLTVMSSMLVNVLILTSIKEMKSEFSSMLNYKKK